MNKCRRENAFLETVAPKKEIIWAQYVFDGKVKYIIASTALRDYYHLYEVKDNKPIKTKYKARSPTELEKYIYS